MREGLIPAVLGTVVTASGCTILRNSKHKLAGMGVLGFGAAHVILGAIDLIEHR